MKPNWLNIWTGGSAVILVGSEILVVCAATAWATSGLLHLGPVADMVLMAIAVIATMVITAFFARSVFEVEPAFGDTPAAEAMSIGTPDGEVAL